ncbi:MAG: hypothetical protein KGJ60_04220 [Verrucomicrobiota bacterium]|nr:hypothetical protein [Verrucomicrobiota bacterium]MDE3066739.1 hypothetical protein [Verrucomicrobiota bacterium]
MPGASSEAEALGLPKRLIFQENQAVFQVFAPPISWGTKGIIPLPVVLSRKIFKKVTQTIFPRQIRRIRRAGVEELKLVPRGE